MSTQHLDLNAVAEGTGGTGKAFQPEGEAFDRSLTI
jgi:hypothetical protein